LLIGGKCEEKASSQNECNSLLEKNCDTRAMALVPCFFGLFEMLQSGIMNVSVKKDIVTSVYEMPRSCIMKG
jgi:hypothetical protein